MSVEGRVTVVYFIQRGKRGPIKIGITTDVVKRLRGLQTACAERLRVLHTMRGGRGVERKLHAQYGRHRISIRGEWFRPHKAVLALVAALKAGERPPKYVDPFHAANRKLWAIYRKRRDESERKAWAERGRIEREYFRASARLRRTL